MKEDEYVEELTEVCRNCGLTLGSHCATTYYSNHYKMIIPRNYCPGNEGQMNWDKGPGTVFETTCKYKDIPHGTPANGRKEDN